MYQNAKKWHAEGMVVYYLASNLNKFAAVASKKVGKAVVRNLVKRRIRAAFAPLDAQLKDGIYIVIAKSGLDELPFEKAQKSLKWALKKMDSLK